MGKSFAAAEFAKMHTTSTSFGDVTAAKDAMDALKYRLMAGSKTKMHGHYSGNFLIVDEVDGFTEEDMKSYVPTESPEVQKALNDLAAEINEGFKDAAGAGARVELLASELLTTLTAKGYSKTPHIGGEDFIPVSVHLGKRGKLIAVFKPTEAAAYQVMEMAVDDAITKLSSFDDILDICCEGGYKSRLSDIRKLTLQAREVEELAAKGAVYEEYGSW